MTFLVVKITTASSEEEHTQTRDIQIIHSGRLESPGLVVT